MVIRSNIKPQTMSMLLMGLEHRHRAEHSYKIGPYHNISFTNVVNMYPKILLQLQMLHSICTTKTLN